MRDIDKIWMAYIDNEVAATCKEKGWGRQLRRKWSVRDKPVPHSSVEDYEWKIIPGECDKLPDGPPTDFDEGTYYVLSFDRCGRQFVFQHDTVQCGVAGRHWNLSSYTQISLVWSTKEGNTIELVRRAMQPNDVWYEEGPPPDGWLRDYLIDLTSRFKPNRFSIT